MAEELDAAVRAAQKEAEKIGILPQQGMHNIGQHVRGRVSRRCPGTSTSSATRRSRSASGRLTLMPTDEHDPGDQHAQTRRHHASAIPTSWCSARTSAISAACSACTEGLQKKYGKTRVFDTPITEGGIIGAAVGMGAYGLRPVLEIQFADYIYPGFDQLVSEAARLRYRSAASSRRR